MRLRTFSAAALITCLGSSPAVADPVFDGLKYQYFLQAIYDGKSDYDAFTALNAALFGQGVRNSTGIRSANTGEYASMAYMNLISLHGDAVQNDPEACTIAGDITVQGNVDGRLVMEFHLPDEQFEAAEALIENIGPHPIHSIRPDIRTFFTRAGCSSEEFVKLRQTLHDFIREKF